jgi:hypothetical protein
MVACSGIGPLIYPHQAVQYAADISRASEYYYHFRHVHGVGEPVRWDL